MTHGDRWGRTGRPISESLSRRAPQGSRATLPPVPTPRATRAALAALALAALAAAGCAAKPPESKVTVPTPGVRLIREPGCELYAGSVAGNDATMRIELLICPAEQGIDGLVQFSSPVSGWSLRRATGGVGSDGILRLSDVRMLEYHPSDEWRFCLVDNYELRLERSEDGVYTGLAVGGYVSRACSDQARIALARVKET